MCCLACMFSWHYVLQYASIIISVDCYISLFPVLEDEKVEEEEEEEEISWNV